LIKLFSPSFEFTWQVSAVSAMIVIALLSADASRNAGAKTIDAVAIQAMPQSATEWRDTAIGDINAAYQLTLANHPGSYDLHNPDFLKNLQYAKERGLGLAARVTNAGGYVAALQRFNVLIHDGHAGVSITFPSSVENIERWPGFVTAWRGAALYVYAAEDGAPQVGAEVIACDGTPIKELITTNVFTFQGRIDELGHWWVWARKVFEDRGNPFIVLPKHCQFSAEGKLAEQELVWKPSTEQAKKWREESYNGDGLDVGITEPRANLFWVAMPTFQPDEKQRESYRVMGKEVEEHRQRYLDADAIVIDLRQNQGGSSLWSHYFSQVLWGQDRVQRRMAAYFSETEVWWRASKDNTAFVKTFVDLLRKEKRHELVPWMKQQVAGMRAALKRGDNFYVEKRDVNAKLAKDPDANLESDPAAFNKPVYVIVPGQCASACLDALDVFTRFANTKLIGAPSAADSTYLEARGPKLGSGLAQVIIPLKVYVNRPRANGQGYFPEIYVNDLVWSSANFLKVVEHDLAKQGSLK
jgi:hypothetical protein